MPVALRGGVLLLFASVAAFSQQYSISTIAGGGVPPTPSIAVTAAIGSPQGIAVDAAGNVYFTAHNIVLEVDTNGILTRVAGNSISGYSGDGGTAIDAQLNAPSALAMDSDGNLYIADTNNNVIRRITPEGVITTVAGNGSQGYSGDGGHATSAALNQPNAVAVDASGALYISDFGNGCLRTVSPVGIISTIIVTLVDSPVQTTQLRPLSVAVNPAGGLYIIDFVYCLYPGIYPNHYCPFLEAVSPSGVVTTIGNGGQNFLAGGAVAVDATGGIYVEIAGVISKYPALAGTLLSGPNSIGGIAVDTADNLYFTDTAANQIRKMDPAGVISTIAGSGIADYSGDGGPGTSAQLSDARSVAVDTAGNVYIADVGNNTVRTVGANGVIVTVAGNGAAGSSGDDGPAGYATLNQPQAVAFDRSGELYIADTASIRKISANGIITNIAATVPKFSPGALVFDGGGNPYAINRSDNRVYNLLNSGTPMVAAGTSKIPICNLISAGGDICDNVAEVGDGGHRRPMQDCFPRR
jgi:sugar lactone lactonase YvrE